MRKKWMAAGLLALGLTLPAARGDTPRLGKPVALEAGGQAINIGGVGHSAPCVHDIDGDGNHDLLVGTFSGGQLRIYRNRGTNKAPTFDAKYDVLLDGKPEGTVPTGWCIGFTPQVVDLDGDGISDILSGSWPGQLYFFKGLGKGAFAGKQTLKDQAGKDIKIDSASTVFAVDWNADGKLDLLIGDVQGRIHLMLNEGSASANAFTKSQELSAGGVPIQVGHGDSHPIAVDWDGDKLLDLLVGCGDGEVLFYKNQGSAAEPKLAKAETLVAKSDAFSGARSETIRPGGRVKICVVDWNGDGRLDLLTGDFCQYQTKVEIPEKDKKAVEEARRKQQELMKGFAEFADEYGKAMQAPRKKETPEEQAARQKKLQEVTGNKEYQQLGEDLQQTVAKLAKLSRSADPSAEEQKEMAALRAKLNDMQKKYAEMMGQLLRYQSAPLDEPAEKAKARLETLQASHAKQIPIQIELMLLQEITRPYDANQMAGSIWLYLRE